MLLLFRDLLRFSYNHGLAVVLLISPYLALLLALQAAVALWAHQQPALYWLYFSVLLAVYPFYVGRVIKYLAWLAGPEEEAPARLDIDAQEWRRLFLVNLLVTGFVGCGLFLLLLPGVYLAARFAFAEIAALLRQEKPLASLQQSWSETEPHLWTLFFGILIIFALSMLLEIPLQVAPEAATGVRLANGLAAELVSIVTTLALVVFAFRVYCLPRET